MTECVYHDIRFYSMKSVCMSYVGKVPLQTKLRHLNIRDYSGVPWIQAPLFSLERGIINMDKRTKDMEDKG